MKIVKAAATHASKIGLLSLFCVLIGGATQASAQTSPSSPQIKNTTPLRTVLEAHYGFLDRLQDCAGLVSVKGPEIEKDIAQLEALMIALYGDDSNKEINRAKTYSSAIGMGFDRSGGTKPLVCRFLEGWVIDTPRFLKENFNFPA